MKGSLSSPFLRGTRPDTLLSHQDLVEPVCPQLMTSGAHYWCHSSFLHCPLWYLIFLMLLHQIAKMQQI